MQAMRIFCMVLAATFAVMPALAASDNMDFSALDKTIREELKITNTPGCAVAIVSGNDIVYAKGFGVADIETGQPVAPDTLFRVGSTSKVFTAITLVSLAEEGKVDLSKPIGYYIPNLSTNLSKVTASQLLSHTAGFKDAAPSYGLHDESELARCMLSLNDSILFAEPGEVFSYSNIGFGMVGYLVEKIGKKTYADQIDERIFRPLGMNRTTFKPTLAMTYPLSQGHSVNANGTSVVRPYSDNAGFWPSGFVFSSVNDMAHLAIALMNNGSLEGRQVISPKVIEEMSKPRAEMASAYENGSYGYGLMIYDRLGQKVVGHDGAIEGFTSNFMMVPEHKFALIILANADDRHFPNSTEKAFRLMLPLKEKAAPVPPTVNQSETAGYVGNYSGIKVLEKEGKLFMSAGVEVPLVQTAKDRFDMILPGSTSPQLIGFIRDRKGEVKYLSFGLRSLKKT